MRQEAAISRRETGRNFGVTPKTRLEMVREEAQLGSETPEFPPGACEYAGRYNSDAI